MSGRDREEQPTEHDSGTTDMTNDDTTTDAQHTNDGTDEDGSFLNRRAVLAALGAGGIAGVVGCSSYLGGQGGGDGNAGGGATPTPTPTKTATPTPSSGVAGLTPCAERGADTDPEEEISTHITSDTTLGADVSHYRVTEFIELDGAELTIEPGTTLSFAQGTGIEVHSGGKILATGTCAEPVVFTGAEPIPGYWVGLYFNNEAAVQNELTYTVVEYGGTGNSESGGIFLGAKSRLALERSTLRKNDGYGIVLGIFSELSSFAENALTGNTRGAAWAATRNVHMLDSTSTYTGNEKDVVDVDIEGIGKDQEVTWPALDAPYRLGPTDTEFDVWGHLTLEPGATLQFRQDVKVTVGEGGKFTAVGTSDDPITLTGTEAVRGFWHGVNFSESVSAKNRLKHAVVEYAGSKYGNVGVWNGSRVAIDHCTLRESKRYGFMTEAEVTVASFTNNTCTANGAGPVFVPASLAHVLDGSCSFTGNDADYVTIEIGTGSSYGSAIVKNADVTWQKLDVPYHTTPWAGYGRFYVKGKLTLEPGVTIRFAQHNYINVTGSGSLTMVGTPDDPITLTGQQPSPGFWGGVFYSNTVAPGNKLKHVILEYAGKFGDGNAALHADEAAALYVVNGGTISVSDSTVRHSAGHGIGYEWPDSSLYKEDRSTANVSNVTFENIAGEDIYKDE